MQDKYLIAASILCTSVLSAFLAAWVTSRISSHKTTPQMAGASASVRELKIVDGGGRTALILAAPNGTPSINLLSADGKPRLAMTVDAQGYSSVRLTNPNPSAPVASFEIDDKGTHIKFDRPNGASSYLFLNNSGGSGAVFIDTAGTRKLDLMVSPSGKTEIRRYDEPSSKIP